MFKEFRFFLHTLSVNLKNAAEMRTSFLMQIVGMILNNIAFLVIWTTFAATVGEIRGWQPIDIIGMFGFCAFSVGVSLSILAGIERLPNNILTGAFDRFMIYPKNILLRVLTQRLGTSAIGDAIMGLGCLTIWAVSTHANAEQLAMIALSLITSLLAFTGGFLMAYSVAFFLKDPDAGPRSIAELILTPSLFHGGAFPGWMRIIFTFVLPSLLMGTLPIETIKAVSWLQMLGLVAMGIIWLAIGVGVFYQGVKKYESASIGGFGN